MTSIIRHFSAALCMGSLWAGAAMAEGGQPQINVTGTGMVLATPDMARVTLGVSQDADTAAAALDAMSASMEAVLAQLRDASIAPEHVQTSNLRIDQRYSDYVDGQTRKVIGYTAASDVQVQVFDLENLGVVLDAAVRDGANQMNGLSFDVADRAPFLTAARQAAVADARAKAEVYSTAAGTTLGPIMLLSEGVNAHSPMPKMAEMSFDAARSAVPVAAGELEISATLTMIWELEQ
ncbi:SIMPL domain-containing protein [Yoonia sp. MH D7]